MRIIVKSGSNSGSDSIRSTGKSTGIEYIVKSTAPAPGKIKIIKTGKQNLSQNLPAKRSQIAIEYMIIAAFILFITIPSVIIYTAQSETIKDEVTMTQAYSAIRKIADSSESIFYLGPPSKETIKIYLPERIDNATVSPNEILLSINGKNIYVTSKVQLEGTIMSTPGIHEIEITAVSNGSRNLVRILGR